MKNFKLWKLNKDCFVEPVEVEDISQNKPAFFYFAGVVDFSDERVKFTSRRSLLEILNFPKAKSKFDVYCITSVKSQDPEILRSSIDKFNDNPLEFKQEGQELYSQVFERNIPSYNTNSQENDINNIKLFFSRINFIGHSYGAVFLGQISNSIVDDMSKKGYNESQIESCLDSLIGCYIGPSRRLSHSNLDIPSLYSVSEYDPFPKIRGDFENEVDDNHGFLPHRLNEKSLVLYSKKLPVTLDTILLKKKSLLDRFNSSSEPTNEEYEKLDLYYKENLLKLKGEPVASKLVYKINSNGSINLKKESDWQLIARERLLPNSPHEAHSEFFYTNKTKTRPDFTGHTFQANYAADAIHDLMREQLKTSLTSIESGEPRSGMNCLNYIIGTHLTTEAKDLAVEKVKEARMKFEELKSLSDKREVW